jgi:cell wall-associated NlpC family hydrolase
VSLTLVAGPVAAATTEARRVVDIAKAQSGDRYSFSAIGPNQFDCSGLVFYAFKEAGLRDRIGDTRRTAAGYYKYFNSRGKADKVNPRLGDLVVWGNNEHMGIYIGDGMAVSALVNPYGVKIHPVKGYLNMSLKAYLHVKLGR